MNCGVTASRASGSGRMFQNLCARNPTLLLSFLLVLKIPADGLDVNIVTLGTDKSFGLTSLIYAGPAMDLAIADAQQLYGDTFNFTHTYIRDKDVSTCFQLFDNTEHMISRWYYKDRCATCLTVLIMTGCLEVSLVGKLAAIWNILFITTISNENVMRNKKLSPTWISTSYIPQQSYATLLQNVMSKYNWTSIFVVVDSSSAIFYTMAAAAFVDLNKNVQNGQLYVRTISSKLQIVNYTELLNEFHSVSRVLIFFGHASLIRQLLVNAAKRNMTNGEHVYVAVEPLVDQTYGNMTWQYGDKDEQIAQMAFQSLLMVLPLDSVKRIDDNIVRLGAEIFNRSQREYGYLFPEQVLNETLSKHRSFNFNNGKQAATLFFDRVFPSKIGEVSLDKVGQRQVDLAVSQFSLRTGERTPFLTQLANSSDLFVMGEPGWSNNNWPPLNEPFCGYTNQKNVCLQKRHNGWIYGVIFGSLACLVIATVIIARRKLEFGDNDKWWNIKTEDFLFLNPPVRLTAQYDGIPPRENPTTGYVVMYKNNEAYLKPVGSTRCKTEEAVCGCLQKARSAMAKDQRLALLFKQLREVSHDNVNRCYGIASSHISQRLTISVVSELAGKGSIRDFVEGSVDGNWHIISSFIFDLLAGLKYIHASVFSSHGHLSSTTCLVDKYFTLKIGSLCYERITKQIEIAANVKPAEDMGHRDAPQLKQKGPQLAQSLDIHATGLIILEIIARERMDFYPNDFTVPDGSGSRQTLQNTNRVNLSLEIPENIIGILMLCGDVTNKSLTAEFLEAWFIKALRPTTTIFNKNLKLIDKILLRFENYSAELESQVEKRSQDLIQEMLKCDLLLSQMLPVSIAKQLRSGDTVHAELFDQVTILFSDLVGFAEFVASAAPMDVTSLLAETESVLDKTIDSFELYKVEAIGDTYVVASGVPVRKQQCHAWEVCALALVMRSTTEEFSRTNLLGLRIGIHSGPCAAGVVGFQRPRYCLFGDTINTASRMCTHGEEKEIHVSAQAAKLVMNYPGMFLRRRGLIAVKGKQEMETFWLNYNQIDIV